MIKNEKLKFHMVKSKSDYDSLNNSPEMKEIRARCDQLSASAPREGEAFSGGICDVCNKQVISKAYPAHEACVGVVQKRSQKSVL